MRPATRWTPPTHERVGPLAGYRILDLSAFAVGPWAACLLATLGADVVKVDPPYGDHIRHVKPSRHGEGTTYTVCNLGKRNIELDLKDPAQRAVVYELAAECDAVVENSREGAMDRLGVGFEALRAVNPRIVYCASSSFGSSGPLARVGSTDPQGQAFSGFVSIQGDPEAAPEFLRYFAAVDLGTSSYLAGAVLAGLYQRELTGRGCVVKTSQFEGALALQATRIAEHLVAAAPPEPMGSATAAFVPSQAFRCRDGRWLSVSAPDDPTWSRLCTALNAPDLAADQRYTCNRGRVAHRRDLVAALADRFAIADSTWWRGRLAELRVPAATPLVLDDLMRGTGADLQQRFLTEVDHPVRGTMRVVGPPWTFDRTPVRQTPAPLPGQHNADLVHRPVDGSGVERPERIDRPGTAADGSPSSPLVGLRIVEIAQGIAGPYTSWLMSALGGIVVKVEPPTGDHARSWSPADESGESAVFRALNRGKHSIVAESGRIRDLLVDVDVVVVDEDVAAFGVDDLDALLAEAADQGAVVCRVSALGDGTAATELEVQTVAGLTRYIGSIGEPTVRVGADLAMTLAGSFAAQAVLAALIERQRSGRGQTVHVSALGALLSIMSVMVAALDDPAEWGGFHCLAAAYPRDRGVTTADGAISFSAPRRDDAAWVALCHELGAGPLADDNTYRTDAQRTPRSKELNRELAQYTTKLPTATVLEATHRHGGLGVPVQTYDQVFAHPQAAAMDIVDGTADDGPIDSSTAGDRYRSLAAPWRVDGRRTHVTGRSPQLGEHG